MKFTIGLFIFFIFSNCTFYDNYEDFDERKKIGKTVFKENMQECEELGHLQASSAKGSKRADEILIDRKRYFLSCMERKGWVSNISKRAHKSS